MLDFWGVNDVMLLFVHSEDHPQSVQLCQICQTLFLGKMPGHVLDPMMLNGLHPKNMEMFQVKWMNCKIKKSIINS